VTDGRETRYAKTTDGVHIAYQVIGGAPLDLLVFSGGLVPIDTMDEEPSLARFYRRLASFSRVVRFDPRGSGMSDPMSPSSPPTLEQWVQDAVAVLDAAGSRRAALFAYGPAVQEAVLLSVTFSSRVVALVLVNGSARLAEGPDYPIGFPRAVLEAFSEINFEPDAMQRGFDVLSLTSPSVGNDPAFRRWWDRAGNRAASPAMARALMTLRVEADIRDLLPLIQVPTLIVHRRDNQLLPVGHGRYLREHIPGAKYVELPGADNLYWVGDTDQMLDEIEETLTGARHGPEPDRMLATVLFTDIVGSTERIVEVGERRWRDLLDLHDTALRRQLERFRGREIKTTGDGVLATFDGPARAVQCACAIRDAAAQLGLQVRAGVHTGEVEIRGTDIGGMTVHIGQRVSALAGPGEVMVSSTVKDLVIGAGIEFDDRGDHELKGVPGVWRIFSVVS
jgi:class 3 adenylate cyclase